MAQEPQPPQSLSPSQGTGFNSLQPRLRQTCDACTIAKVKCDKGRPACQRCLDGEELCQYSPSRRHGKRAKRARTTIREEIPPSLADKPRNVFPQPPDTPIEHPFSPHSADLLAWDSLDSTSTSTEFLPTFGSQQELDLSNLLLWNNFGGLESVSQKDPNSIFNAHISPIDQALPRRDDRPSINKLNGHDITHGKEGTEHALECEARALAVLQSLQCSPALCAQDGKESSPISNPSTTPNTSLPMPYSVDSMDTLLATNKAALTELTQMLECRCSENSHVALLHLTILSKIVFWYNVVVTARYNSEKVELKPMKIQFGMLDLDEDDCATLHRAVLCRELQKAGNAVRAFEVRFASSSMPLSEKEPPWGRVIIRAIREDLERSISEIERGQCKPF